MIYYALTYLAAFIKRQPSERLAAWANALAFVAVRIFGYRRRLMLSNARKIMAHTAMANDEAALLQLAQDAMASLFLTSFETMEAHCADLSATVTLKNDDESQVELQKGKGIFFLSIHAGNWETIPAGICRKMGAAYVPVKKVGGNQVNRFVVELRTKYGLLTAERKQKGDSFKIIRSMIEGGHIVGFMQDQARPGSPRLPFFGHSAKTNISMAAIWRKFDAPMIPALSRRIAPRQHVVEFFPKLPMQRTDNEEADLQHNIAIMNRATEQLILANPSQFLLMHDRWK